MLFQGLKDIWKNKKLHAYIFNATSKRIFAGKYCLKSLPHWYNRGMGFFLKEGFTGSLMQLSSVVCVSLLLVLSSASEMHLSWLRSGDCLGHCRIVSLLSYWVTFTVCFLVIVNMYSKTAPNQFYCISWVWAYNICFSFTFLFLFFLTWKVFSTCVSEMLFLHSG